MRVRGHGALWVDIEVDDMGYLTLIRTGMMGDKLALKMTDKEWDSVSARVPELRAALARATNEEAPDD